VSLPDLLSHPGQGWQAQLRGVITSRDRLLAELDLSGADVGPAAGAGDDFPLKVPHSFVRRMRRGDPRDPLLLQVLSSQRETTDAPGFVGDPLAETGDSIPRRGILHKYHGRVLLIVSGACAVNCRYCFRRHFPYHENRNSRGQWRDALQYIRADSTVEEVILSGGDPLVATDQQLRQLVGDIAAAPHVKRLRIHSRLPVVIPERVTGDLLDAISHSALRTTMVVHCNHANEIDESVCRGIDALLDRRITVLNQAVLLRGINDSLEAQVALSKALFAAGALPYYLHLLDRVSGAAHFDVPESRARILMDELAAKLPGYLVPKLAREVAGAGAKQVL
jgi:EF-P beta-lysylation protein EpmB